MKPCCSALSSKYEPLRVLGQGGQGIVFLCKDRATGNLVACKTCCAHYPKRVPNFDSKAHARTVRKLLQLGAGLVAPQKSKGVLDRQLAGQDCELRHEIHIMHRLAVMELGGLESHNILPIHSTFDSEDGFAHLITPFCAEGSLFDMLRSSIHAAAGRHSSSTKGVAAKPLLNDCEAATIITSLAKALAFCHSHGIVHRDVKLENVFLRHVAAGAGSCTKSSNDDSVPQSSFQHRPCTSDNLSSAQEHTSKYNRFEQQDILLADFGIAVVVSPQHHTALTGYAGTPMYMAPEVQHGRLYNEHADIWSLGILLHVLLTGMPLPITGRPHVLVQDFYAYDLLRRMLAENPAQRITLSDILSHPWIVRNTGGDGKVDEVKMKSEVVRVQMASAQLHHHKNSSCRRAIAELWHNMHGARHAGAAY